MRKTQPLDRDPTIIGTDDENWRAEQRENWRRQLRPQWVLVIVTAGAVVVAAITIGILNGTLRATKDAADAAKGQADTAKIQADAALATAQTAQTQLHITNRPWLEVAPQSQFTATFPFGIESDVLAQVIVKNVGKSVALNAKVSVATADFEKELEAFAPTICKRPFLTELPANIQTTQWGYAVFPDAFFAKTWGILLARDVKLLDQKAPINRLWVYGCITYDDQFLRPHWTRFCYESIPNGGNVTADVSKVGVASFQPYDRWNDTDAEKTDN